MIKLRITILYLVLPASIASSSCVLAQSHIQLMAANKFYGDQGITSQDDLRSFGVNLDADDCLGTLPLLFNLSVLKGDFVTLSGSEVEHTNFNIGLSFHAFKQKPLFGTVGFGWASSFTSWKSGADTYDDTKGTHGIYLRGALVLVMGSWVEVGMEARYQRTSKLKIADDSYKGEVVHVGLTVGMFVDK